jgi:flagellar basal body rod protein FlgG
MHRDQVDVALLVQRPHEDEDLPGAWGLPAATLAAGESWEDAARRAGAEKLGVTLDVGVMIEQGPETLAQIGRLKLVNPEADRLGKRPDGLIQATDGEDVESDANVKMASGFIETSNVNIASTLVDMIEFQRQYEVAVRMMQTADQNASRAADLASIS